MLRRGCYPALALAVMAASLAGCSSPAARRPLPEKGSAAVAPAVERAPDAAADKVAQGHAHYAAAVIHEMNDEAGAALEDYYEAALADPGNEDLVLEVSRRFLQSKQPEKALEVLRRAADRPDASAAIFARLGLVYSQLGRHDQAISSDRAAIKRDPGVLAGYQNLFLTYAQTKQDQAALKVLDEAARQPKVGPEFLLGVAELYNSFALQAPALREKCQAGARSVLERAQKMDLTSPLLRLRLADGFNSVGQAERAAQLYLELLKQLPDVPLVRERVHAKLATIYLRGSNNSRAREHLEAMLRDDPTNPQVYYYLGRIAYDAKQPAEAVDYFRKALVLSPDFEEAWFYLAVAQLAANQVSDALATLEKARQKTPGNFDLELWTGLAFSEQKAYRQAVRHFTEAEVIAKATEPTRLTHEFYFQAGAACERSGDHAQAARHFERCLEIKPDWPQALNYLGYMWAEDGTNLVKARELIEKAVRAEPKNGAYLDSLGWVLFKLGQLKEGLALVLKAVEVSTQPDPTEYEHLGDIYAALEQPAKAREAWAKSLSLEPNDAVRKKLEAAGGAPQ